MRLTLHLCPLTEKNIAGLIAQLLEENENRGFDSRSAFGIFDLFIYFLITTMCADFCYKAFANSKNKVFLFASTYRPAWRAVTQPSRGFTRSTILTPTL